MTSTGPSKDRQTDRIAELETELERLQSSARFQLGDLLVSLGSPASWLGAPRRLARITHALLARADVHRLAIALEWGTGDQAARQIATLSSHERRQLARECAGKASDALPGRTSTLDALSALVQELRMGADAPASLFAPGSQEAGPSPSSTNRVLFIVRSALPAVRNGYALRTHALARALIDAGWTVCVAVLDEADRIPEEIDGVLYQGADAAAGRLGPEAWISARTASVSKIAAGFAPDIIHAASNFLCAAVASRIAAAERKIWTYEVRGLWHITRSSVEPRFANGPGFAFQQSMEREAVRQANYVFANGPALEAWAAEAGALNTQSIPNCASAGPTPPMQLIQATREQWGVKPDVPVIGYLGRFTSYEGLQVLMEASALLTKRNVHHTLVLAGDGPEYSILRRRAAGTGQQVVFTGQLDDNNALLASHAFDIHAVPRLDLPVTRLVPPLKPLEAMTAGRPLVVSDLPSMSDIIAAGAALACRANDAKSLASALERLIRDEALRARLGKAGRRLVNEQRSWDQAADHLSERWRAIAGSEA
ncbi:MAG: glycosyltransferase(EC:2.4.-) [Oceanicaulis sp. HLUCCA04]|nr:MAG: glycosyltransferase(EC:2.4.-) [Oceanicaulis sp. HLUCCA04]